MFFENQYFYYFTIGLQAICAIHCLRKGNQGKWIWVIVFLPIIGCLIYFFSEIITGRDMKQVQSGLGVMINPSGNLRQLEEKLRFSDTFHNKVLLADAYFQNNQTEKAIQIYESCLSGVFEENEHVLIQLIGAYSKMERYEDILPVAEKVYKLPQFAGSGAHMLYAIALEKTGHPEMAEKEFRTMKARFAYFEPRYHYGIFLIKQGRDDEAFRIFNDMLDEAGQLSSRERNSNRKWLSLAKDAVRKTRV
jgi:hypothetical protein